MEENNDLDEKKVGFEGDHGVNYMNPFNPTLPPSYQSDLNGMTVQVGGNGCPDDNKTKKVNNKLLYMALVAIAVMCATAIVICGMRNGLFGDGDYFFDKNLYRITE